MSAEGPTSHRGNWYLLTGLLLGLALGLLYAWVIAPVEYVDSSPAALRGDFKDQYRLLVASAYQQTGNLGRAQARLSVLGDPDAVQALIDQAQRLLAVGDPEQASPALASLADALRQNATEPLAGTPILTVPATQPPNGTPISTSSSGLPAPFPAARLVTPTPGANFVAAEPEKVCKPDLPAGLLQVEVRNDAGQAVPGTEVIVSWYGGEAHFFTGFKPDRDKGYADFIMTPGVAYTLQLARDSAPITGLSAPDCSSETGKPYWGGISVVFQQP